MTCKLNLNSKTLRIKFSNNLFKSIVNDFEMEDPEFVDKEIIEVLPTLKNFKVASITSDNCFPVVSEFASLILKQLSFQVSSVYIVEHKIFENLTIMFEDVELQSIIKNWYPQILFYSTLGFETICSLIGSIHWSGLKHEGKFLIKEWKSSFVNEKLFNKSDNFRILLQHHESNLVDSINVIDYCIMKLIINNRDSILESIYNHLSWNKIDHIALWMSKMEHLNIEENCDNRESILSMKGGLIIKNNADEDKIPNLVISRRWFYDRYFPKIHNEDNKEIVQFVRNDRLSIVVKSNVIIDNPVLLLNNVIEFEINYKSIIPKKHYYIAYGENFKREFLNNWIISSLLFQMFDCEGETIDHDELLPIVTHITSLTMKLRLSDVITFDQMREFMIFDVNWYNNIHVQHSINIHEFVKLKRGSSNFIYENEGIQLFDLRWKTTPLARCIIKCLEKNLHLRLPNLLNFYGDNSVCCENELCFDQLFESNYKVLIDSICITKDGVTITTENQDLKIRTMR